MRWFKKLLGLLLGGIGIALVAWKVGWIVVIGMTLAVWGNNLNWNR